MFTLLTSPWEVWRLRQPGPYTGLSNGRDDVDCTRLAPTSVSGALANQNVANDIALSLSLSLSVCLSVNLSVCLSLCLFVCLS